MHTVFQEEVEGLVVERLKRACGLDNFLAIVTAERLKMAWGLENVVGRVAFLMN